MLRIIIVALGVLLQAETVKPIVLNWVHLQRVNTRPVTLPGVEGVLPMPVFTQPLLSYAGKQVEVDGFVIPLDKTGKTLVLSAYAMNECFFCGKAGPASVMTVQLRKPSKKFKTDDVVSFRGKLRLNETDPKELFYILENAVEVNY